MVCAVYSRETQKRKIMCAQVWKERVQMMECVSEMLAMDRSGWRVYNILYIMIILATF